MTDLGVVLLTTLPRASMETAPRKGSAARPDEA
jgi:hypothetical protein